MTMSYDPLAYEMPWRPNYEKNAVAGWLAASGAALAVEQVNPLANAVSFVCAMQVHTFHKVHGHAYASTMCIGNFAARPRR